MKKYKEWLKDRLESLRETDVRMRKLYEPNSVEHRHFSGRLAAIDEVLDFIDELDEPEVLSQEWISDHIIFNEKEDAEYIYADKLQNLIVPKQELPVIPKYVADYLYSARGDVSLMKVMELVGMRHRFPKWKREYDWISENQETFARAWLDGFTVEKEQKYYAKLKEVHPPEKEWLTNLSGSNYYAIDTKGLMLGEFILDLVGIKTEASTHTVKDWERHGINDSNADFVKVEELEE